MQSDAVAYHGQFVAAVVAETLEIARQAASLVAIRYEEQPHDVELRADRGDLYAPESLILGIATDTTQGDVEAALAAAPVTLDHTYTTPAEHNNPLEPHATVAVWSRDGASVTLYDANQGADWIRDGVATAFELPPERVRVIAPYVGGGFGSKGFTHPHVILAVMAAQVTGRPAKLALTRQQMFALAGYRSPTIQRIRLGAERDGRLTAIAHEVVIADLDALRAGRAGGRPDADDVRGAQPPHHPSAGPARRPGEHLDARAGRVSRACSRSSRRWTSWRWPAASIRSSYASATNQRSTLKPDIPFSSRGLVACLRRRRRALRLAAARPDAAGSRRDGPLARRDRRRRLDLSRPYSCPRPRALPLTEEDAIASASPPRTSAPAPGRR